MYDINISVSKVDGGYVVTYFDGMKVFIDLDQVIAFVKETLTPALVPYNRLCCASE